MAKIYWQITRAAGWGGGTEFFHTGRFGGLTLFRSFYFRKFRSLILCRFLRKIVEITLFRLFVFEGAETFFKDVNGGTRTFFKYSDLGPNTFSWRKMGEQRLFLDRKIKVFPNGVPVNFGHSLTIIV